jgi:hypothetical protein
VSIITKKIMHKYAEIAVLKTARGISLRTLQKNKGGKATLFAHVSFPDNKKAPHI